MSYDLFILYSSKDGFDLAKIAADALESALGLKVYVAERQDDSRVGLLDEQIRIAIRNSRRFVVLLTPHAIRSNWVLGEITAASDMKKDMLIFRRQDVSKSDTPIMLQAQHQIEFAGSEDLADYIQGAADWGIPVVIPAGGKGSHLYPVTIGMPKALLPVSKKPLIHHILVPCNIAYFV